MKFPSERSGALLKLNDGIHVGLPEDSPHAMTLLVHAGTPEFFGRDHHSVSHLKGNDLLIPGDLAFSTRLWRCNALYPQRRVHRTCNFATGKRRLSHTSGSTIGMAGDEPRTKRCWEDTLASEWNIVEPDWCVHVHTDRRTNETGPGLLIAVFALHGSTQVLRQTGNILVPYPQLPFLRHEPIECITSIDLPFLEWSPAVSPEVKFPDSGSQMGERYPGGPDEIMDLVPGQPGIQWPTKTNSEFFDNIFIGDGWLFPTKLGVNQSRSIGK
ncbi:MAG: hypothetical protein GY934_02905, partial [Gammaproteobacteria bacterium]|nr:hypothetical protein [Gammaproteobacteria bacterium]